MVDDLTSFSLLQRVPSLFLTSPPLGSIEFLSGVLFVDFEQ